MSLFQPEPKSTAFDDIVRRTAASASDDMSLRKLIQRIIMLSAKEHDVSLSEVCLNASDMEYVTWPKATRQVKLTDTVMVNVEAGPEDPIAKSNNGFADLYWHREEDPKYQKAVEEYQMGVRVLEKDPKLTSLYEYATFFDRSWQYMSEPVVVVWAPFVHRIPSPKDPKWWPMWCKNTLLLHKPGAKPADYAHESSSADENQIEQSLYCTQIDSFVRSDPNCPVAIRLEYLKKMEQNPMEEEEEEENEQEEVFNRNFEELAPQINIEDPLENLLQEDWMVQLGPANAAIPTRRITEQDLDMETVNEEDYIEENITHDANHDWSLDAQALNLSTERQFMELQNWLKTAQNQFVMPNQPDHAQTFIRESLNENQRIVFDAVMQSLAQSATYHRLMNTNNENNQEESVQQEEVVDNEQEEMEDGGGNQVDEFEEEKRLYLVNGPAGTGKSFLINTLLQSVKQLVGRSSQLVRIACPTGTAASQFDGGKTLHSLLKINPKKSDGEGTDQQLEELTGAPLQRLQYDFQDTEVLIIGIMYS